MVGNDAAAGRLRSLLVNEGIATDCLIESPDIPTIVKTRIIARQQQVVRVDRERRCASPTSVHDSASGRLAGILPGVDGVIFEDYGKGFLTQDFVDRVSAMIVEARKDSHRRSKPRKPPCGGRESQPSSQIVPRLSPCPEATEPGSRR